MDTDTVTPSALATLGVFSYDSVLIRFADGVFPSADLYALLRDVVIGNDTLAGWMDNIHVTVDTRGTVIRGSLPAYRYGTNAHALPLREVRAVLVHICHRLGINSAELAAARVFRIDAAVNVALAHPVANYVALCLEVQRAERLAYDKTGVVFTNTLRQTAAYDKARELAAKGKPVPEEWDGLNVARLEVRFRKQLAREFGGPVYAADLWGASFFAGVVRRCVDRLGQVRLARDLRVPPLTSVRTAWDWAALRGIRDVVGEARFLRLVNGARESGQLRRTQASRLRAKLRAAAGDEALTVESDLADELTAAIHAAAPNTLD